MEQPPYIFTVVKNDDYEESWVKLVALKNIFRKQLPKMPGEYIARLVFDQNHENLLLIKTETNETIGGICYRVFECFVEIVFLAITYSEQVKGFGTKLMNELKNRMKNQGIYHMLTYADNFAIGYFTKQGFNCPVMLPERIWKGQVKEYDGGTFMHCALYPQIENYHTIQTTLKRQQQQLEKLINQVSIQEVVWDMPQLAKKLSGGRSETEFLKGMTQVCFLSQETQAEEKEEAEQLAQCYEYIIDSMDKNSYGWPFRQPVTPEIAQDYFDVIKNPIDLSSIRQKVKDGAYKDPKSFVSDVKLMLDNARLYNKKNTVYYKAADRLEEFINPLLSELVEQ